MQDLELLLNTLLKMGWKPWGNDIDSIRVITKTILSVIYKNGNGGELQGVRKLVSLESGLWKFCAENDLLNINERDISVYRKAYPASETEETIASDSDYQYRLLEAALVSEEDLVEFLLGNIILEG